LQIYEKLEKKIFFHDAQAQVVLGGILKCRKHKQKTAVGLCTFKILLQ
jgi:hypothetical protein